MSIIQDLTRKLGLDKIAHFSSNFLLADITIHAMGEVSVPALGVIVAIGIVKEAFDKGNTPAEHAKDVLANVLGILTAAAVAAFL